MLLRLSHDLRTRFDMSFATKVLMISTALLLLGCGVWANVGEGPLPEVRGAWVTQAMRGRV
jgi:hypothetical protein